MFHKNYHLRNRNHNHSFIQGSNPHFSERKLYETPPPIPGYPPLSEAS